MAMIFHQRVQPVFPSTTNRKNIKQNHWTGQVDLARLMDSVPGSRESVVLGVSNKPWIPRCPGGRIRMFSWFSGVAVDDILLYSAIICSIYIYIYIGIMKEASTIGRGVSDFKVVFCGEVGDDERKLDS